MNLEETNVGCFQIVLLFLLSINYVIVSMSHALPVFHNYTPKFYCESNDGTNKTYGCASSLNFENASLRSRRSNYDDLDSCANGYIWEAETNERSVVTDWSLICEKSYLMYLGPTVYYVGISIGAWVAGILADRIGRLPVLAICLYIQGTMAVATYIVQSYPAFLILRGLQGVFAQGLQNTTYILTLELFPKKFRTIVAMIMEIFWALGIILLAGLSYIIPDWRILQLAASVPTAATVLYIWIIPESPRWLLAKGKSTEADISLEKIVKYNACCTGRTRRALVTETADNSVNTTPAKPERKSRLIREPIVEDETKETRKIDEACESTNLLTPPIPVQRKSRRTSLRGITGNFEKRQSSVEIPDLEIQTSDNDSTPGQSLEASSSTKSNRNSRVSSNYELSRDIRKSVNDEILIVKASLPEVNVDEPLCAIKKNEEIRDIEKMQEPTLNVNTRRNRFLTKYMIVMACEWFTASVMRNVVNEISPVLSNDRHVAFAIGGGLEAIAYVLTYFVLSRYGRRIPMSLCQFVNGVVCITVGVVAVLTHSTIAWIGPVRIVFLLIGRTSVVCSLATAYLFTVEIFPTVIRGTCLGLCAIAGMIGSLSSPHILSIRNHTTIAAPLTITGILCLISGLICLILPETMNDPLPDTVTQIGRTLTKNKIGVAGGSDSEKNITENRASKREVLREKLFSEDWVDAGNGIIVNFSETKN